MAAVPVASEHQRLIVWRVERALKLGYPLEEAANIAWENVDLHRLADLIKNGCPLKLAHSIEAP